MPVINKYHIFGYRHFCRLSAFICMLFFLAACHTWPQKKGKEYFTAALKKLDSSYASKYYYNQADIQYLDTTFTTANGAGLFEMAKKHLIKTSYYRSAQVNLYKALLHADSVSLLLKNNTADDMLGPLAAQAFFNKGDIYFKIKNYNEAINNYTQAKIILSTGLADPCKLFGYYHSMGFVLYAQQKYLLAARFFRLKFLTAAACRENNHETYLDIQENMSNTGMGYFRAGLTDSAVYYYNTALDYINRNRKRFPQLPASEFEAQRAVVYFNQGEVLYHQKDTAAAENLFLKSMAGCDKRDTGFLRPLYLSLANLYLGSKQPEKAGYILNALTRSVDSSEISQTAADFYKTQAAYYRSVGQLPAANKALQRSYNMRDSVEKRDRRLIAIDFHKEFENREQHIMKQALQKDNELKKNYLLVAMTGIGMTIILILLTWYNLRRKSVYAEKLNALNSEIISSNHDLQDTLGSLQQSHDENSRLMRVVAHDLKNPISAIRSLVYSLLKREQTDDNRKALQLVQATSIDSISLIKDLLENKRTLSAISKELVDMGRLIEQCTELSRLKANEKNQRLQLDVDYPVVMLNRQKILRVINNIVNNAIKFSPANTDIIIRLKQKDESVLLSVKDNGTGIPSSLHDKLFTLGTDTSAPGTSGEISYGMGLPVSRKIIEEHHGKLWFETEAGKGSVFYVELPYSVN